MSARISLSIYSGNPMKLKNRFILFGACLAVFSLSAYSSEEMNIPFRYAKGQVLFEKYCSACHGANLTGTEKGPPLLHSFYKPSHHGDAAFYRAALKGVKAHHWNFGDMPPVPGMDERKIKSIVPYIRYYQQQKKLY
jgi:mono/diheme cytochrome c family protein